MDPNLEELKDINKQLEKFKETNEWIRRNQTLLYLSDKIKEQLKKHSNDSEANYQVIRIMLERFLKQVEDKVIEKDIYEYIISQGLDAFYKVHDLFNFVRDIEDQRKKLEEGL